MSLKIRGILVLVVGTVMGVSLSLGGGALADRERDNETLPWAEARLLAEVMERVKQDYVDPVDDRRLLEAAIRGMVADLDPHSQFLDPREYEDIRISTTGNYSGVGIEVSITDGAVRVVSPIDDTPAQRAGLLPGDNIVSIDGVDVDDKNINDTVMRMRGRQGTEVRLSILRDPQPEPIDFTLKREFIRVISVRGTMLEDNIGYIRVSQFNESTANDLRKTINNIQRNRDDNFKGLVLDLRNNPGGVLDAAVDVADLFLEQGLIVTAEGRTRESQFKYGARRGDTLSGAPMVVLVNAGSASASEIVAGALQDHDRATLLGTATYGKGSVQTVMPLSDGNAIKLTTSKYFTPSGDSIHEIGIQPDIEMKASSQIVFLRDGQTELKNIETDAQLSGAIKLLHEPIIRQSKAQ